MPNSALHSAIARFNDIVQTTNICGFEVQDFDVTAQSLLVIGSFDLAYYHELEARFDGVTFVRLDFCAMFSQPRLSIGDAEVRDTVSKFTDLEPDDVVFIFHDDPSFHGGRVHFIVADDFNISEGMVYHYQRANLQQNERIAPWVKPDS